MGVSEGQERSAEALRLSLPVPSVLFDVAQCSQAFQQGWVRVVPHGKQPVCHREAKVVLVELNEGRIQLWSLAHVAGKGICLKLEPATQDRQTKGQQLKRENVVLSSHRQSDSSVCTALWLTFTSLYGEKMNWKIIINPISVGWESLKPKATNSSLRPINAAKREKHKKEFIWKQKTLVSRKTLKKYKYYLSGKILFILTLIRYYTQYFLYQFSCTIVSKTFYKTFTLLPCQVLSMPTIRSSGSFPRTL